MAEQIYKLTPDRDLQCYFLMPSAIAAMSQASDSGFAVSGKWRQQFDWCVVEWNRDNVFEHPALRYLPDGDLSGLTLTYQESRTNCIPLESNLDPVVDWNNLRVWATDDSGVENLYHVNFSLANATPVAGNYVGATATMTLTASPGVGNRVGLALLENHHYYKVQTTDTLKDIAQGVATAVNGNSEIIGNPDFMATIQSDGVSIQLTPRPNDQYSAVIGANCNRVTAYGFAQNAAQCWAEPAVMFSGGAFPTTYQITINFGNLVDSDTQEQIPTNRVRKLRWTWAADMQPGSYEQAEFQVTLSNWTVTGNNRQYSVAGPGSRRIEDSDAAVAYNGSAWALTTGNYSGSKIHSTNNPGDSCTIVYTETAEHELYLGTRLLGAGATVDVSVDGQTTSLNLLLNGEDVLVRSPLGSYAAGTHTVQLTHAGPAENSFYFDFLEIAYPSVNLPDFESQTQLALATDWDTYHSQSLPAERTAWLINKLGFQGRVNHYTGALWFYEIVRTGTVYASLTVTLTALPFDGSPTVILDLASADDPTATTQIKHLVLLDDTPATVALALAGLINVGTNLLWASTNGDQLTFTARAMGTDGNGIIVQLDPSSEGYSFGSAATTLSGGVDGTPYDLDTSDSLNSTLIATAEYWRTDLTATPRINRAARDWHTAYFTALKTYGIDAVASFSTELMNGDPSEQAGIAQRYPDNTPVVLSTPSIQTNFSPTCLAYWTQVYLDMATLQSNAGITPYLQSGEVQWWYFQKQVWDATSGTNVNVGMPFYDAYTEQQFQNTYGVPMQVILSNDVDPSAYPNETAFLPTLIGAYTAAIRSALQAQFPGCRFEVLYPTDTNDTSFNQLINFPSGDWTPTNLNCLKTESFTFTGNYNLDQSSYSMSVSAAKGFPNTQRSHLVGISDAWTAWMKEIDLAQSQGMESVVLFALDQYCLVGYASPPFVKLVRTVRQG
ncbi:MAG TPA: hypothetical protein VMF91_24005 [Bryobacteraceae bacterium]|nr:hypothetical protein [Bryobacteraceae bacterium]